MKLLQITKYFYPHQGGIESNVLGSSRELVTQGHEVTILAANDPPGKKKETYLGIKVRRSAAWFTAFRDPFTPGMLGGLFQEDYQLLHLHLPDPFNSVFALLAAVLRGKPLVVTYHADIIKDRWYHKPFTFLYDYLQRLVLKKAEVIIATSPGYAKESKILRHLPFWEKIEIVPNFVDEKKFSPQTKIAPKMAKLKKKNEKLVLFLGRLIPYKGVDNLLTAFTDLKSPQTKLVIAGRGSLKETLHEKSKGMKNILFLEPTDEELRSLYRLADVFVLPSVTRQEAFGIALLEAMASGTPCVSTNFSGMPYVIGESGMVVPPHDPPALRDALEKLLENDQLRTSLGQEARRRVEEQFTRKRVGRLLLSIYRRCLEPEKDS